MDYSNFFDQVIDRHNSNSMKWDAHEMMKKPVDTYPLWVADMDFKVMPEIVEALEKEVQTALYGYTFESDDYTKSIINWLDRRHQYKIKKEWITSTPGVVSGVNAALLALTNEGDHILLQEPVYYPFKRSILTNKRKAAINELIYKDGEYTIDYVDFEKQIKENEVKLFILCSPHNPVGKVFSEDELNKMVDICKKYDVIIVSDEIHMDFVYKPYKHIVTAELRKDYADHIITLYAASKTFNLAGMKVSQLISSNPEYIQKVKDTYMTLGLHGVNTLGLIASTAAYTYGDDYVDGIVSYLDKSIKWLQNYLETECPQVKLVNPQGTYILWLDFKALNMKQEDLDKFCLENAKMWLNNGAIFGQGGEGFMRINLALPLSELKKVMHTLKKAIDTL